MYLQQGVFTSVSVYIFICVIGNKCIKTVQFTCVLPPLCGSLSWKVTTEAMKRRMTRTHQGKETTNRVTYIALEPEAGPMATDTYKQKKRKMDSRDMDMFSNAYTLIHREL